MTDKQQRLQELIKDLESLQGPLITCHKEKVTQELMLQVEEDVAREEALESGMPISKISHFIKAKTKKEREKAFIADANYKCQKLKYDTTIELINGLKFDIRLSVDMANNNNY